MHIEIINTGSELMLGRVLNTHQQWLCRQMADAGYVVARQVAIADTASDIQQAVREALSRADLVLCTGGLGPTADDLTRDCLAELLGKRLQADPSVLAHLEAFYATRKRCVPPGVKVQALVPEGAKVLPNSHGTAPGLCLEVAPNPFRPNGQDSWLILLPGPPRELYPMFSQQVAPWLQQNLPPTEYFRSLTLKTTGFGESQLAERLEEPLRPHLASGVELGYCARVGEVELRLAARGPGAQRKLRRAETAVRKALSRCIFGVGDDRLEAIVIRLLTERNQTLALAESCTGGFISHRLTNVPGASAVLMAGMVTYSNEAKQRLLGIPAQLIMAQGAVSELTARAMAERARHSNRTDYGLAVTGIAGPDGGTATKPVGTVFIALASDRGTVVRHRLNQLDRESFKQATAQQALELLRRTVLAGARPIKKPQASLPAAER